MQFEWNIFRERIKDFMDLRGANWATNSTNSTSGHFVMLKALKEYGENPSFFGNILGNNPTNDLFALVTDFM